MICIKCIRYKIDQEGIPYKQSCKIEQKIGKENINNCKSFKEIKGTKQLRRKYRLNPRENW